MSALEVDSVPHPTLDRSLPGWAVDVILDGLPAQEAFDHRRVWGAYVGVAMSAYRRGWTEAEFVAQASDPSSRLWMQLMTRRNGRRTSMPAAYRAVRKAWHVGVANARDVGCRTADELRADAVERAYLWDERLKRGDDNLSVTEKAVMAYVIAETERRQMLRVTCPGRAVAEYAQTSHRTAARMLSALADKGLLVLHSPGRRGKEGKGRAAIYALTDPERDGT